MDTNRQFIIYGAGMKGLSYLQFLKKYNLENFIKFFCDKNASEIGVLQGIPVVCYEKAKKCGCPFLIGVRKEYEDEIVNRLKEDGQEIYLSLDRLIVDEMHLMSRVEFEREICALSHIDSMDSYFEIAESDEALDFFWNKEGDCYRMFRKLDLTNVVELACGRGRHVARYVENAKKITLVDILDKNISICKERFVGSDKISYIVNNGYDLQQLQDESYTALFTYDSMVHFELLDIANYLSETYRILEHGGRALFHHSNYDRDYRASYDKGVESRSFMNSKIFAYLAYRAGFEIEEQLIVDWIKPELDCLTLVKKR